MVGRGSNARTGKVQGIRPASGYEAGITEVPEPAESDAIRVAPVRRLERASAEAEGRRAELSVGNPRAPAWAGALRCQVADPHDTEHVWPLLDAAFREYGLPLRLRSDNGPPFATTGAGGLSRLAVKVIKAGVTPERIRPGKPQENGRHERLHLTLLQDTADPPAATLRAQQRRFRKFQAEYNEERPHAALGNATPAERYAPSPRRWDGVLRSPEPATDAVRRVKSNGLIRWHGVLVDISEALGGEPVGLDEGDDGLWTVRYGPILLGLLADRGDTLIRLPQKGCGLVDNAARSPQGPQPPQPQPTGT